LKYKKIRINDFITLINPFILDVREPYEYQTGNIPRSINIPIDILLNNHEKYLYKNQPYYLYCETGLRSGRACEVLSNLGYDVYSIEGGYRNWLLASNNY